MPRMSKTSPTTAAKRRKMAAAGAKGGQVRAQKLTPERRHEISRGAALARWHGRKF